MEAGEDLHRRLAPRFWVLCNDDLRVVLDDVGEAAGGEHLLPEVVGLEAIRVWRITGPVVPPAVERQEPRGLAFQRRAEADLLIVDSKMHHAPAELEESLAGVAIALILLDRILGILLGEIVLQLERSDWQPIDEDSHVEGQLSLVPAVSQLARDAEA